MVTSIDITCSSTRACCSIPEIIRINAYCSSFVIIEFLAVLDEILVVNFQGFSLDISNRQLKINSTLVDIDDRAFVVFELLIKAYPNTCSKQQLLDAAWPDTVVSEWSLPKLISDTRKIFIKAGYDGPIMQTIHGKGYRLPVELAKQLERPEAELPEASTSLTQQVNWKPSISLLVISMLMLVAMVVAVIQVNTKPLITQEPAGALGRILWVDDNPTNNVRERAYFEDNKVAVYAVESSEEALRLLSLYQYQVIISDMGRHGDKLAGLHLLEEIRAMNIQTPFVLYTWHSTPELINEIGRLGGQGVAIDSASLYGYVRRYIAVSADPQ